MIVGIDPGMKGGIVALNASGFILWKRTIVTTEHKGTNEIDSEWLYGVLRELPEGSTVITESCAHHYNRTATMRSCAMMYGAIVGLCNGEAGARIRFKRVQPRIWQKEMLGKVPKGKTKEYALRAALLLWPTEHWKTNKRPNAVPHDGLIDAALIAEYGRKKFS